LRHLFAVLVFLGFSAMAAVLAAMGWAQGSSDDVAGACLVLAVGAIFGAVVGGYVDARW
jgi:hypothetical protein